MSSCIVSGGGDIWDERRSAAYARAQGSCGEPVVGGFGFNGARNSGRHGHPGDAADNAGRQKSQGGAENRSPSDAGHSAVFADTNSRRRQAGWTRRGSDAAEGGEHGEK